MKDIRIGETVPVPRSVITIAKDAALPDALRKMREHSIHHLVVLDGPSVVGVLSHRDLFAKGFQFERGLDPALKVEDVMDRLSVFATERTDLGEALRLMRDHDASAVPLVEGNTLVGIITETDLLHLMEKALHAPAELGPAERSQWLLGNPLMQNVMHLLAQAGI